MIKHRNRARLFAAAASLLLLAGAGPALAAAGPTDFDADVQCSAFQRWGAGGWTAIAPTTLDFGVTAIAIAPGQSFGPGQTVNGIAVPAIIDRHCGNP